MNYQHIINQCDDNGVEDSLWDYLPVEPVVKVEALDDDDTSDDEIVPSAIVEPILLKPDSAEDEEIVLDLKPEPYLDNHTGRMHMEPYSSHDQSWSSDMARRTIQELNLRAADSKLAAVQARRRAQRLLGPAGIHKIRSYMVAFQHQRYTAKYGFYSARLSAPPPSYWHQPSAEPLLAITVGQLVDSAADRFGSREALVSCHQGVRLTFSEVKRRVDRLAAGLLDAGLRRGDRLALWGGNSAEWYLAALAAGRAGMVLVCANPAYEVAEFRYCLNKVGARGVVAAEACYPKVLRMAPQLPHSPPADLQCADVPDLATVVFMEGERKRGAFQLRELMDSATRGSLGVITNQQLSIQPDDGCNILFTSGTTAKPKAAILTHHNIINNSYFVGKRMQFDEKHHRICLQVPLFHCYGFCSGVLAALHHGATVVLPSLYFNTKASLDAIEKEKCTVVYGTPTMYVDLVAERDFEDRRFETLETAVSSGSPISHPLFLELKRKFGVRKVGSLYGLTETSPVVFQSQPTDSEDQMLNTVGAVSQHVEVKVVDEQRKVVPMGTVGELCVRGYVTVARYWSDEESTRRLYYRERWLRTGDLFIMREDGYGKLVGHLRDRIIRDGENIFPKEIQELLETHPDILETQVFGVPHERWGQQICACIRLKRGSTLTSDAVREFASGKISDFKIPSIIEIVDELPRNPSGKIQILQLREAVMEKYGIKDVAIYGW